MNFFCGVYVWIVFNLIRIMSSKADCEYLLDMISFTKVLMIINRKDWHDKI